MLDLHLSNRSFHTLIIDHTLWYHYYCWSTKNSQYLLHCCNLRESKWMKNMCQLNATYTFFFPWQCRAHSNYGNIMYDRRVVRGNTYAQHIIPTVRMKHLFYYAWHFNILTNKNVYFPPPLRWLSRTLLKYKDNRRSGEEPLLENEPGSSLDPRLLRPCRAENTLMSKRVRHFSGQLQTFYIFSILDSLWACQMCCWRPKPVCNNLILFQSFILRN